MKRNRAWRRLVDRQLSDRPVHVEVWEADEVGPWQVAITVRRRWEVFLNAPNAPVVSLEGIGHYLRGLAPGWKSAADVKQALRDIGYTKEEIRERETYFR